ncbi:hypothetical protein [Kitasatospora sp. NPDC050543]|uniref:hypothetical protein n=1 Tax=Kitasatospora sp. NPDC050543 TaxID=3364054 RepID=UPI003791CB27
MQLTYVYDAYCGRSYGSARTLAALSARHPRLPVEVVSGGPFTGARRVPVREFGQVQGADARITELTGVPFGEAYERLIADGSCVMDSAAAARADFRRARELGVDGYPTLLAVDGGGRTTVLATGHATARRLEAGLAALHSPR